MNLNKAETFSKRLLVLAVGFAICGWVCYRHGFAAPQNEETQQMMNEINLVMDLYDRIDQSLRASLNEALTAKSDVMRKIIFTEMNANLSNTVNRIDTQLLLSEKAGLLDKDSMITTSQRVKVLLDDIRKYSTATSNTVANAARQIQGAMEQMKGRMATDLGVKAALTMDAKTRDKALADLKGDWKVIKDVADKPKQEAADLARQLRKQEKKEAEARAKALREEQEQARKKKKAEEAARAQAQQEALDQARQQEQAQREQEEKQRQAIKQVVEQEFLQRIAQMSSHADESQSVFTDATAAGHALVEMLGEKGIDELVQARRDQHRPEVDDSLTETLDKSRWMLEMGFVNQGVDGLDTYRQKCESVFGVESEEAFNANMIAYSAELFLQEMQAQKLNGGILVTTAGQTESGAMTDEAESYAVGDILTAIEGEEVRSLDDFQKYYKVGARVTSLFPTREGRLEQRELKATGVGAKCKFMEIVK